MNPRHTRVTNTLAAAALPLALLVGCSGEEPEPKFPDEPSSSPTEASPSEPVEPTPPAAMERGDEAGAKAFVEYYYAFMNYAQQTGDVEGFRRLGLKSCAGCEGALEFVDGVYKNGGQSVGGIYTPRTIKVTGRQRLTDKVTRVFLTVVASRTKQKITGAGPHDGTYPAGESRLRFQLIHDSSGWQAEAWRLA